MALHLRPPRGPVAGWHAALWTLAIARWLRAAAEEAETFDQVLIDRRHDAVTAEAMYSSGVLPRLTERGISEMRIPDDCFQQLRMVYEKASPSRPALDGGGSWRREPTAGNLQNSRYDDSPTYVLRVPRKVERLLEARLTPVMENWTQRKLKFSNEYGIRCYTNGSVLLRHVDRGGRLASALLSVAYEVEEPWELLIEAHEPGSTRAVEVKEGDMLLYESYRLPHWRPKPLVGWACNLFLHWTLPEWDASEWDERERDIRKEFDRQRRLEESLRVCDQMHKDEARREWHEPGPMLLFASEYKSGTHLAADLAKTLLNELLSSGMREDRDRANFRVFTTKKHSGWVTIDDTFGCRLRQFPNHRAVLFFRDPVDMLASLYLYARNTSECAARNRFYRINSCDLQDTVHPDRWDSVEDGLRELSAKENLRGVVKRMERVRQMVQGLENAHIVWMDGILRGHSELDIREARRALEFLLAGGQWSPPAEWFDKVTVAMAARVRRSIKSGGVNKQHVHANDDRAVVVAKIRTMARKEPGIRWFLGVQRKWAKLREDDERASSSGRTEL